MPDENVITLSDNDLETCINAFVPALVTEVWAKLPVETRDPNYMRFVRGYARDYINDLVAKDPHFEQRILTLGKADKGHELLKLYRAEISPGPKKPGAT